MNNSLPDLNNSASEYSYLLFGLSEKIYAINVKNVLEVIKFQALDSPQRLPKHIIGVVTYNGMAINIVDLRTVLSLPTAGYSIDAQIIIVKTEESIYGVLVDRVMDVFLFESSNMHPLPYHSDANLIKFFYQHGGDFASVIDLESVEDVLQKTQFEKNEFDVESLFPKDLASQEILKKRQLQLIDKALPDFKDAFWDSEQYIVFSLNDNLYAIDITYVKEIVNFNTISLVKLPLKYDYMEGIFNLKGFFISTLNLKKFLQIEGYTSKMESAKLIVLELKDFKLAFLVDDIVNIINVSNKDVIGSVTSKFDSKYNLAEICLDEKIVSVLNLERILSDERLYIQD